MQIVVTGANRGIGLELTRQLLSRGDQVIAAVRNPDRASELRSLGPDRLSIHTLDIANSSSVHDFAQSLGELAVDAVINNAGVWGGENQAVSNLDFEAAMATYNVNALGALRVTLALLPHLRRGTGKRILHVTSGLGSSGDNSSGGHYAYRMSKAALNMAARSLAVDLAGEGIACSVINPGWVKTDMGGANAPTKVADSASGILRELDALGPDKSGAFLDWTGKSFPW